MNPVEAFDGCADTAVHPDKVRLASANAPDANEIARVSAVFKLLGDPTRTRLLYALLEAGEETFFCRFFLLLSQRFKRRLVLGRRHHYRRLFCRFGRQRLRFQLFIA